MMTIVVVAEAVEVVVVLVKMFWLCFGVYSKDFVLALMLKAKA